MQSGLPTFAPPSNETSQVLVYHLAHSLSPSAQEREAALAWLQACQAEPGFQHCLVEVVAARELGKEVRTQAVLYFKNCLDKYWKSIGKHVLNPQEKHTIREKLLSLLDEEDSAIAKTLAFCVGRIARKDYPKEWPDLFDRLLSAMQHAHESIEQGHAQARIILHRALLFFQQAVKALSENRTIAGKNVIGRLCEQAFVNLSHFYQHVFHRALQSISSNHNSLPTPSADGTPSDLDLSLLIFKILSKLVVYGWGGAGETQQRKEEFSNLQISFFISSMQDFTTIYQARQAIILNPSNEATLAQQAQSMSSPLITLNKHTLAYGKMYMALLFQNHIVFHKLGQTPQLVQLYWSFVQQASQTLRSTDLDNPASLFPLKFVMQSLLFVKHCFTQFPYKNSELESQTFATECTECIILRLLPLRQADLDKWQEDPEEFIKDEEDEKWKFDIRPCAEAFLKELIREYEHTVFQISEYRTRYQNATTFEDLLVKEAIYAAISHCSLELTKARYPDGRQLLPYLEWLSETLLPEAMSTDQTGIIVRRRIAPIASAFIAEYPAAEAQSLAYQVIMHLMQRNASTDLAVRMAAAKALGSCDAWDLDLEPLLPFLETAFVELGDILQQVDLPESKMLLNDILGTLIVRVDRKIQPHLERLMEIILQLWASASDDPSKQAIVATFKKLVDALGTSSPVLHSLIRQLVQESCDPNSPSHVLLQDDGLELWRSALRFTAEPTADLIALAPLSVQLLSQGSDILRKVLRLVQSYIVLQPDYLIPIFTAIATLLQNLSNEATKPLLYTVDMVVQSTTSSIWAPAMLHSGLFHHTVKTIATDPANPSVTRFLPTLARLAISDGAAFTELLRQSASQLRVPYDDLAQLILQKWLDRYDNLTYPAQRKLVALGLTSFVQTTSHAILDKIDEIIGAWLSALGETEESANGEYVANISGEQQGAPSDIDEWQTTQQIPPAASSHSAPLDTSGPQEHQHPSASPTISLSSTAEPSFCFMSEASSSRSSSLCTVTPDNSFSLAQDTTIVQDDTQAEDLRRHWRDSAMNDGLLSSHGPDGHLACNAPWPAIADKQLSSPSSPSHRSCDRWNDNTTPNIPQSSTFSGACTFADYDPNCNYSTHAGHDDDDDDDDNDSTGYTRFGNSAQCYYNSDEHDEEAHLELGWENAADAWGASPETIVPEDSRLKALAARDPLHTLKLTNVISSALNNTAEMNGGMQVFHANYLAPPKVDAAVLEEFQQWLSGLARGGD